MKQSFADILRRVEDDMERKVASKMPQWASAWPLEIPAALNFEQCSSTATALFKAGTAASLLSGKGSIADLTGGLGVDSWAFSKIASKVWYNEMNEGLKDAVARNYEKLGVEGVTFNSFEISASGTAWFKSLKDFAPDLIYLDPARRSGIGKKVFLLEDCSPNVLEILPRLFELVDVVMMKLSPMADISMAASRLGCLESVTIVSLKGEVKELLCVLRKGFDGGYSVSVRNLDDGASFTFRPSEEASATAAYADEIQPGTILFEPSAAMMKSGAFKLLCTRFGMKKFAPSTHLYITPEPVSLGRSLEILEVLPLGGTNMKELGKAHPHAEVCARNIPLSSEQLRIRMGIKPGPADCRIYGCSTASARWLIVTKLPE